MIEPGATDPRKTFRSERLDGARDDRSMLLLEYLISIIAFLSAALLAIVR